MAKKAAQPIIAYVLSSSSDIAAVDCIFDFIFDKVTKDNIQSTT